MRAMAFVLGAVLLAPPSFGQSPQVQIDEIIRRGDMVEHVGGDIFDEANNPDGLIRQVVDELPKTDLDKWHIYVVGTKGCAACKNLAEQWKSDPVLRAYAKPDDPKGSWANFTYYRYDDELQRWRWTRNADNPHALEITSFPTIVCQPPRNGKWNANDIVHVFQYRGDPKEWSQSLNAAIKLYVSKVHQQNIQSGQPQPIANPHPAVVNGAGQQTIPPLDLPNDEPDAEPANPLKRWNSREPEIIIVTDQQLQLDDTMQSAINDTVAAMQPANDKLAVRKLDIADIGKLPVNADEVPVVLKVEGKHVLEKRDPKLVESKGLFLFPLLAAVFGLAFAAKISSMIATVVQFAALLAVAMVAYCVFRRLKDYLDEQQSGASTAPANPAVAPTFAPATPQFSAEELAAASAILRAAQEKKAASAA